MADLPGHVGVPLFGDCSTEFYKDVMQFIRKQTLKHKSAIFSARFLNTPTVFVTTHAGVKELLNEHHDKVELGYKAFMHQMYGDNVIFANGSEADSLRTALKSLLMSDETREHFGTVITRLTEKHLNNLENTQPTAVYKFFKVLVTEICLCLFLDVDFDQSEELSNQIISLTGAHWQGIISVPVSLKLGSSKSQYCKALEAKGQLLTMIQSKLAQHCTLFSETSKKAGHLSSEQAASHLLLFISALIPKAFASILTSFVLATADDQGLQASLESDAVMLHSTVCEVQRMWPPLVGGRRIAKQDFPLCGYHVPAGHAIVYLTHHAQRDPAVFTDPDTFKPERWTNRECDPSDLFVLGNGPRDCIGRHLVLDVIKIITRKLSERFSWRKEDPGEHSIQYKWLPILRPKNEVKVRFEVKDHQPPRDVQ